MSYGYTHVIPFGPTIQQSRSPHPRTLRATRLDEVALSAALERTGFAAGSSREELPQLVDDELWLLRCDPVPAIGDHPAFHVALRPARGSP